VTLGSSVVQTGAYTTITVSMDRSRFTGSKNVAIYVTSVVTSGQRCAETVLRVQANCVEPVATPKELYESLHVEFIAIINKETALLKSVVDQKTAESVVPAMRKLQEERVDTARRFQSLAGGPDEENIGKRYLPELTRARKDFFDEWTRVTNLPGCEWVLSRFGP
jgi:hypothetical protein